MIYIRHTFTELARKWGNKCLWKYDERKKIILPGKKQIYVTVNS